MAYFPRLLLALSAVATFSASAADLQAGDQLTIIPPAPGAVDEYGQALSWSGLSWFGIELGPGFYRNDTISQDSITPLYQGDEGLIVGRTSVPGANHPGSPTPADRNAVTAPVEFLGTTGSFFLVTPASGGTDSGLDLSGWRFTYNGLAHGIPLGAGAWQPSNCASIGCDGHVFQNGYARFQWDGVYGSRYVLDYSATVPAGDPSGLGGSKFYLHLEGAVLPVPEPAPGWLFAGAIPLVAFLARRRRIAG